jgi:hypothetical protein
MKARPNTRITEPIIVGSSDMPSKDGPKVPQRREPIHAPMMPTIADVRKPPGMRPGRKYSAIQAQAAATIRNKIKPIILIKIFNLVILI